MASPVLNLKNSVLGHAGTGRTLSGNNPYLTWAADSYYGEKNGLVGNRDYPLSWEANASQANYAGVEIVSPQYTRRKLAAPHTWHAAEMFLRLLSERKTTLRTAKNMEE